MAEPESSADGRRLLAKNTGLLYLLSLSSQLINLALIPYQTRVLGSEAYGIVAIAVSLSTILTIFLDFGFILSATERTVGLVGDARGLGRLVGSVAMAKMWLASVAGVVIVALVMLVPPFNRYPAVFILYYMAFSVNAFMPDFFYRGYEDMKVITVRTVIIRIVSALPLFVILRGPEGIWTIPALLLVGNAGAVAFSYRDIRVRYGIGGLSCRVEDSVRLLRASFGFFVSRFASVFYQSMNGVLLGFVYPGQAIVGQYGAAEKFLSYAKTVSSPVADSLYPYMVKRRDYRLGIKVLMFTTPVILICAAIAWAFAEPICLLVFGDGYEESATLLRCLMPAIVVIFPTYILCFPFLVPMGLSRYANTSNVVGALVQIVTVVFLFLTENFDAVTMCIAASASEVAVFLYRLWAVVSHRELLNTTESIEE